MAIISDDTFDPLRRFVGVRLQQGVPIVDADWNELEDVREFELRAFLKWFVGDGIPAGNDGFRINAIGSGADNDFQILRGGQSASGSGDNTSLALQQVGRCLADGRDVIILDDTRFTAQPLHTNQAESADTAARLQAPEIQPLSPAVAAETVTVFLDIWERLVTPAEDPTLVHGNLGVESCARVRREWAVRTRSGAGIPPLSERQPGHSYYELAHLRRRAGDPLVRPDDITDRRERGLLLPPVHLVEDVLGVDPRAYRREENRPVVNLRAAINSLIRGEVLMSDESALTPQSSATDLLGKANFVTPDEGLVSLFMSTRSGSKQVHAARLDLRDPTAGFADPFQLTTGGTHTSPHMARLSTGDWLIAYEHDNNIVGRLGQFSGVGSEMNLQDEFDIDAGASLVRIPFVVSAGQVAFVFYYDSTASEYRTGVYDVTATNLDTTKTLLAGVPAAAPPDFHAATDGTSVFAAFQDNGNSIRAFKVQTAGANRGVADTVISVDSGDHNQNPYLLPDGRGNCWLFFAGKDNAIYYRRFLETQWEPGPPIMIAGTDKDDLKLSPTALLDDSGDVLLFWQSTSGVGNQEIWYSRGKRGTAWETPRRITDSPLSDARPHALQAGDNVWVLWSRRESFQDTIRYRQIHIRI